VSLKNELMKLTATIMCFACVHVGFSQIVFIVDNFSPKYYGKISIDDTAEVFSKGSIAIYEKKTNKQIIQVPSEELALFLHNGNAVANIQSLPYGEQSVIMYDDFNFDNKKDFAIEDGQNSCYHGPSFKIYLATDSGFVYNEDFTRLAQEYCGMFAVDNDKKKIYTMTKSGCCWHEFSEFIVKNNKPKAVKIVTEEQAFPFSIYLEQVWNGKTMIEKTYRVLDLAQESIQVLLSFRIPENGKKAVLYSVEQTLYYALIRKDSTVEFFFPVEIGSKKFDFELDSSADKVFVKFVNNLAIYTIYEQNRKVGIEVNINGKTYYLLGDDKTTIGSLKKLFTTPLDNVSYREKTVLK
jgi:hypothetical protein